MNQTYDKGRNVSREFQQEFRGLNHKLRPLEAEFCEVLNLSAKEYPALTSRRERGYITDIGRCLSPSLCNIGPEKIAYVRRQEASEQICINGETKISIGTNVDTPRKIIRMGAYLCIFPDGIIYNTETGTTKNITAIANNMISPFNFIPSKMDGAYAAISEHEPDTAKIGDVYYNPKEKKTYLCSSVYSAWAKEENVVVYANQMSLAFAPSPPKYAVNVSLFVGGVADGETAKLRVYNGGDYIDVGNINIVSKLPSVPSEGQFVLLKDSTARTNYLYQYRSNCPNWTSFPASYTRIDISSTHLVEQFSDGDVVEIADLGYSRVHTVHTDKDNDAGYIVVDHLDLIGEFAYTDKLITISRKMPDNLCNIIECGNRLWGTDAEGREIYASKLGDPFNWHAFTGISTDSYAITIGSGGKFTGAIAYGGYPHFFKENSILKIYGNYPFRLYTLDCPGVDKNCEKSLAVLQGTIIYKSTDGFYAYDGSYPVCISENIRDLSGSDVFVTASTADTSSYYAATSNGNLLIYEKGLWHIHDAPACTTTEEKIYPGISDLTFTGRDVIAAVSAQDYDLGIDYFSQPSVYLVSLYGCDYSWRTFQGQSELLKSFFVTYKQYVLGEETVFGFKINFPFENFSLLWENDAFYVNNKKYFVKNIVSDSDGKTMIIVDNVDDPDLIQNRRYRLCIYQTKPTRWRFMTPMLGLSLPDDKYYSHLILRYTSAKEINAFIIYDDDKKERVVLPSKKKLGSFAVSLRPHCSEYIRLRLEGEGAFQLFSFTKNIEGGSNP